MFFSIPWTGNAYVLTRSEKVLITKYTTAYELFKLILNTVVLRQITFLTSKIHVISYI